MGLGEFILKRMAKHYQVNEAKALFDSMTHLGRPCEPSFPTELIPMLTREAVRGVFNTQFFQSNRDWVLPYWATRQLDPKDPSFIPRMNLVGLNMTHRNWTAIGCLGGKMEAVVDPRGLITPWLGGWSLDTWLVVGDERFFPGSLPEAGQSVEDAAPMVSTEFKTDDLFVELEAFACSMREKEVVLACVRVQNLCRRKIEARLYLSIRPYNPEGVSPIHHIRYDPDGYFAVDNRLALVLTGTPSRVHCSNFREGDCAFFIDGHQQDHESTCPAGLATAFAEFQLSLPVNESLEIIAAMPMATLSAKSRVVKELRRFDFRDHRTRIRSRWMEKVREGMTIDIPDEELEESFYQNKAYLLLFDDGDDIRPGPLTYHHFWFRDSAYMIAALDKMGYTDHARQKLLTYPKRQKKDGCFLSQEGEWDSTGQAIWTLMEHFRLTGDGSYLEEIFPAVGKGAYWIEKKRKETGKEPSGHFGLLPPGFSAEHLGPNDYFYWDDFWGVAGIRDAAFAADILGFRTETLNFEKFHENFFADLKNSFKGVEARLGRPCLPAGPYRRMDSASVGGLVAVHPLRMLHPEDPLVTNTVDYLLKNCFIGNGLYHDMTHAGINVYLSLHVAQALLARRDARAWDIARDMLARATDTLTWPEAIHPQTGGGCMGDGHHGWAVADWLLFLRNALVMENGNELIITPLVPSDWFDWGKRIVVRDAPTHFGPVSYTVEGHQGEIVLSVESHFRQAPRHLVWHLPFTAYDALVDDQSMTVNDDVLRTAGGASTIRVRRVGGAS